MQAIKDRPAINRVRFRKVRWFFFKAFIHVVWWDFLLNRPYLRVFRTKALPRWQRIARDYRELALELGGVLIKLGQFLSVRVDILPGEVTNELVGLQDRVHAVPFDDVAPGIEHDLGAPLDTLFREISEDPIGAASLAQVYKAVLHTGEQVAVKSLRPGIEAVVESDLAAISQASRWLKLNRMIRERVDLDHFAEEFTTVTRRELDLRLEAENTVRFKQDFADNKDIYIPKIYHSLTARRTLTSEYVGFINLDDETAMKAAGIDPKRAAKVLFRTYMEQIFETNFVHVDPHPGNLFIKPHKTSTGGFQLVFIDFGMMADIPQELRGALTHFAIGVGTHNARQVVDAYDRAGVLLPGADKERLAEATADMLERFSSIRMGDIKNVAMSEAKYFMDEYRDLIYDSPMQLPVDLLFVLRSVGMLSGLTTSLNPEFSPWSETIPFAAKLAKNEIAIGEGDLFLQSLKKLQQLVAIPGRIDSVLSKIESGNIVINSNLTPKSLHALRRIEQTHRRTAAAITGAGMLVSGVQLLNQAQMPELAWGLIISALFLNLNSLRRAV
jgi:predicted unusual protein kinase regulating ubiquinone biosynthesis (AarF/ABC1/UbiB family)